MKKLLLLIALLALVGGWSTRSDTAVRLTHVPSGIMINESGDRSIHRNRAEAMRKMLLVYDLHPEMFVPMPMLRIATP